MPMSVRVQGDLLQYFFGTSRGSACTVSAGALNYAASSTGSAAKGSATEAARAVRDYASRDSQGAHVVFALNQPAAAAADGGG